MLVQTDCRHRVEIMTINRPKPRNAIDYDTSKALADAFDAAEAEPEVWAVVLTGAGDKAFSSGMDLEAFAGGGGNVMDVNGGFAGITRRDFPKPLIAAATAQQLGLVNDVVPGAEVLDAAVALAERSCRNAPLATRLSKQMVKRSLDNTEDEAFDLQGDVLIEVFSSPDVREGPRAFAEKREPYWTGA